MVAALATVTGHRCSAGVAVPTSRQGLHPRGANREHADQLLVQARRDLASAELLLGTNPKRAYESIYDAARMALTAVLENEGLRPTSRGGHIAPYAAVSAQLNPPMGAAERQGL